MSDLLQTIKDQIAKDWFAKNAPKVSEINWQWEYVDYKARLNDLWPEVCKRYALQVAKDALKNASLNVNILYKNIGAVSNAYISKESITSESNIKL